MGHPARGKLANVSIWHNKRFAVARMDIAQSKGVGLEQRPSSTRMEALGWVFTLMTYRHVRIGCVKGSRFGERAELFVGIILLAGTVLSPFVGSLLLKGETHDPKVMLFLFSAFVISLLPAVLFLCLLGVVLVVQH